MASKMNYKTETRSAYRFFDPERFHEQAMGQTDFKLELRTAFLNKMPEILKSIITSFQQQEADELRKSLHMLKGSIGLVCIPAVTEQVLMLETNVTGLLNKAYREQLYSMLENVRVLTDEMASLSIQ